MNPFIQNIVAEAIRQQKWYQRNANTIVAGLVALSAILSFVLTLGLELPPIVAAGIPAVITVIGTMVTKLTRNGVQMSTAVKLEQTPAARATLPAPPASAVVAAELDRTRIGRHRLED